MEFAGICLATKDVRKLSAFYQAVLQTVSDCDGEIHQEIRTQGAALAILRDENAGICGNQKLRMAFNRGRCGRGICPAAKPGRVGRRTARNPAVGRAESVFFGPGRESVDLSEFSEEINEWALP